VLIRSLIASVQYRFKGAKSNQVIG
jgi:hypothetical protein